MLASLTLIPVHELESKQDTSVNIGKDCNALSWILRIQS